jgi:hypothetical protein
MGRTGNNRCQYNIEVLLKGWLEHLEIQPRSSSIEGKENASQGIGQKDGRNSFDPCNRKTPRSSSMMMMMITIII